MRVLADTNILLRYSNPLDPDHQTVIDAITALHLQGMVLVTVPQNMYEFWVAATRPKTANGHGISTALCATILLDMAEQFPLLLDLPELCATWQKLVSKYQCYGKIAHDARLVAAMQTHGIIHLLTFNGEDFRRYPGLTILDPAAIQ